MPRNCCVWLAQLVLCATVLIPLTASAQETDEVSATGKGITGGALLGAEVVMLTEAAIGAKPWWAYLVGGVAGAAGGGVGGYFAEQGGEPKVSLYLLAGGMALAIPTTVAVLSQTAYDPPTEYTQDTGPSDEPTAEPPSGDLVEEGTGTNPEVSAAPRRSSRREARALPPPALFGLRHKTVTVGVPNVEVRDMFSRRELHEYGAKQRTEVRVPLFTATF